MKLFFTIFLGSFCIAFHVHAATISVVIPKEVSIGQKIPADVLINTKGESINSLDISLSFPEQLFTFEGYTTDEAIVPLWIITPKEEVPGVVHFSGVVPGGFERTYDPDHPTDPTTKIVQLFFKVKASGRGDFIISDSELLRNDGFGTRVVATTERSSIKITDNTKTIESADSVAPKPFAVTIVPKSLFGKTPRLALFVADDKEGGIEHYEAHISYRNWETVTSPYPLPYRIFPYTLTIRAFDFAGNYHDQSITVPGEDPQRIVLGSILLVTIIVFFIYRTRNKLRYE